MNDENKAKGPDTIVALPLSVLHKVAQTDPANLLDLGAEWAVVFWAVDIASQERKLYVNSFSDREEASKFLASMYEKQSDIEVILYCGEPKKFEIEVKAKIVLR